ncbi:MAG TPA: SpoIIE family protein phosphatase [Spirochaetota bacterium]|nr:SpoIIE family protein phosphatase [Spirochaetota bacterium]
MNYDIEKFSAINKRINSSLKLSDLLTIILDTTKDMLKSEGCSILLTDPITEDLYFYIVRGGGDSLIKGEIVPKGKGIAGYVALTGTPLIVNNPYKDERFYEDIDSKSNFHTRNIICSPMILIDRLVGVIEVVNSTERESFTDDDLKVLMYIADSAAIAITHRQLYHDLATRLKELEIMYEISQAIAHSSPSENIFPKIMQPLASSVGVKRASILLYNTNTDEFSIAASHNLPEAINLYVNKDNAPIAYRVYTSGDPLLVSNIMSDPSLASFARTHEYITPSFISIPLRYKNTIIGVLNLADKLDKSSFDAHDLRVATTIANQIVEAYQNSIYLQQTEEQRRLAQEIDIAAEIQQRILPKIPHAINSHRLAAFNKSAKEVGGDFYDIFQFDNDKFGLLIADISGKGIPAALFMGTARNVLRAESRINNQPGQLLTHANKYIYEDSEYGMFVTAFYMLIDSHNKLLTYGSGGHNNQLLIRSRSKETIRLNAKGIALGIINNAQYEEKALFFEDNDLVVMFTDGVLDLLGNGNMDEGEKKLIEYSLQSLEKGPDFLISRLKNNLIVQDIDKEFLDDFTVLAIQF